MFIIRNFLPSQTSHLARFSYLFLALRYWHRQIIYIISTQVDIRISSLADVLSCTKSLAGGEGLSRKFLALAHLCGISKSSQKLVARAKSLARGELSASGALSLSELRGISKPSKERILTVTKSLAGGECLSRKFLALSHLRGISKTRNELLLLGAKSLARGELSAYRKVGNRNNGPGVCKRKSCADTYDESFLEQFLLIAATTNTLNICILSLLTTGGFALAKLGLEVALVGKQRSEVERHACQRMYIE